jgi:hypothetical protein
VAEGKSCMWIRYKVLQAAVALLVALGPVAVGGTWAWAQQEESDPAARQGGKCPGAEELGTVGPDDRDLVRVRPFDIEGDKFRITYKTTNLDEDGEPLLDVTVLDEDEDEVGGRVIRDQGTEREIVTEAPGTFSMEIRAEDLTYEITVEDCTGEDGSAADDQYDDDNLGVDDAPGLGEDFGLGDNPGTGDDLGTGDDPGFGTEDGQDAGIPEDVIADTIPERETLPFTGGPPLFGLAFIGLACMGLGTAVLRGAIRRS